jgi:hypothetical protein
VPLGAHAKQAFVLWARPIALKISRRAIDTNAVVTGMIAIELRRHTNSAAHCIAHHAQDAESTFGGGDTSFPADCSSVLIQRPEKKDTTLCGAETFHVYVIERRSRKEPIKLVGDESHDLSRSWRSAIQ